MCKVDVNNSFNNVKKLFWENIFSFFIFMKSFSGVSLAKMFSFGKSPKISGAVIKNLKRFYFGALRLPEFVTDIFPVIYSFEFDLLEKII